MYRGKKGFLEKNKIKISIYIFLCVISEPVSTGRVKKLCQQLSHNLKKITQEAIK